MPKTFLPAAVLALVASFALPATSFAHDPMLPKIGFHFRLALGGDLEPVDEPPVRRYAMDPGYGGGVEIEVPLTIHFSIGGMFEAYAWTLAAASASYTTNLDFLVQPRVRIPFGDHPGHYEVYFGFPIGPSIGLPSNDFVQAVAAGPRDTGIGVTGGLRVGFRVNVDEVVGFHFDAGPMVNYMNFSSSGAGPDFDIWHYQFVLRAGASFGIPGAAVASAE